MTFWDILKLTVLPHAAFKGGNEKSAMRRVMDGDLPLP